MNVIRPDQEDVKEKNTPIDDNKGKEVTNKAIDTSKDTTPPEDKKIIIEGPLSAIYTKALDEIYKNKKVTINTKLLPVEVGNESDTYVYALNDKHISTHANLVTNFLYRKDIPNKAIIMQHTDYISPLREDIKNLATSASVRVYPSLEKFILDNNTIEKKTILNNANESNSVTTPQQILELMKDIQYTNSDMNASYIIQYPEELLKNKIGLCYEQVALAKKFLEESEYECKTFFIYYDFFMASIVNDTHTFLIYKDRDDKYYWFEHSWTEYRGINGPYESVKTGLSEVTEMFKEPISTYPLRMFEYNEMPYNLTIYEWLEHLFSKYSKNSILLP